MVVKARHTHTWRWRRNPLRRGSDVVEAWVLLAAWVIALVGGVLAGVVAQGAVERDLDRQRVERRAVAAVLVEDARGKPSAGAGEDDRVWVKARWTASDGLTHTGLTKVRPDAPAGAPVTVWIDQHGTVVSQPVTHGEAQLQSVLVGVLCAAIAGGAVLGLARVSRAGLDRWRGGQWDAEWARVDTRSSHPTG